LPDNARADGLFLWSFYRGKDADLCLRHLYAYAEGRDEPGDVSASWCVDHLLPLLRRERWAAGAGQRRVVQHGRAVVWAVSSTGWSGCWRDWPRNHCPASCS
jgi:hypothetical protein